ncbi:MAG: hypothetical protein R3B57_07505 [Phycisphaerales bacterium]
MIEVMIAAGVLAVVVALVMPAALGRLGSRSLDQTGQDLAAALTLAQGEAGETGLGVAIRLRPDDAGAWHAESAVIAHAEEVESFDALAGDSSASRAPASSVRPGSDELNWRELLAFPSGVVVSLDPPESVGQTPELMRASLDAMPPASLPSGPQNGAAPEPILLGVFLPGGRFMGKGALYLSSVTDPDAVATTRAVVVSVSAWTGRVTINAWRSSDEERPETDEPADDAIPTDWLGAPGEGGDAP